MTRDIPALAETPKLKGLDINIWFALMAPAQLPEAVASKLKKALTDSLQSPELRKKLEDSGATVSPVEPDMAGFLVRETAKYEKIIQFAKIKE